MPANEYMLSHQDVVRAVIIHQNIHEGLWTLNINFNVAARHGTDVPDPCLAVTIKSIGVMRASPSDPLAIDAVAINPPQPVHIEHASQAAPAVAGAKGANISSGSMQFCRDIYRNVAVQSAPRAPTSPAKTT